MKKSVLFLSLGFLTYCILGMLDYETQSFWDLFSKENLGALPIFTVGFASLYFGIYSLSQFTLSKLRS